MLKLSRKSILFISLFMFTFLPSYASAADCRMGVIAGVHTDQVETNQWIETLDASWYINLEPHPSTYQDSRGEDSLVDARHVPVIHIEQYKHPVTNVRLDSYTMQLGEQELTTETLALFIQQSPGALWVIGNEPDREIIGNDMMPELYARAYHEIREFVLIIDPTAQFANAGLVQVTPSRIQYLDTVMETYQSLYGIQIPVDVWNIHVYPLEELRPNGDVSGVGGIALGSDPLVGQRGPLDNSECNSGDPDSPNYNVNPDFVTDDITCFAEHDDVRIFTHQVEMMRQWMKDNGQQDKPLIISDMGILWPYVEVYDDPGACGFLQDEFGQCMSPRRVSRFMSDVNDYLMTASDPNLGYSKGTEHKLVQQWAWFSVYQTNDNRISSGLNPDSENEALGAAGNLLYDPWNYLIPGQQSALTLIGETFQAYAVGTANQLPPNLFIDSVPNGRIVMQEDGRNIVQIDVPLRNDGSSAIDQEVTVDLYNNTLMRPTDFMGRAIASRGLQGCATDQAIATGTLSINANTTHLYAKISDGQGNNDANTADNVYADSVGDPIAIPLDTPTPPLTVKMNRMIANRVWSWSMVGMAVVVLTLASCFGWRRVSR